MAFDWSKVVPDTTFYLKTSVAANYKYPAGPYRQGSDSLWYYISPFGDPKPWLGRTGTDNLTDPDYITVFGPRPSGPSDWKLQVALTDWEYNKLQFMGLISIPDDYPADKITEFSQVLIRWKIKEPVLYEHKVWGKMGRFLGTPVPELDLPVYFLINYPHHAVSTYQIRDFTDNGNVPIEWHPFVPDFIASPKIDS